MDAHAPDPCARLRTQRVCKFVREEEIYQRNKKKVKLELQYVRCTPINI